MDRIDRIRLVYRTETHFFSGKGGGDSKRGAYLKLGANSSIYGTQHNGATPDSGRKIKEQEDISWVRISLGFAPVIGWKQQHRKQE